MPKKIENTEEVKEVKVVKKPATQKSAPSAVAKPAVKKTTKVAASAKPEAEIVKSPKKENVFEGGSAAKKTKSIAAVQNYKTRRKTAMVLIKSISNAAGSKVVNGVEFAKYFKVGQMLNVVLSPFAVLKTNGIQISQDDYSIVAAASGGGFKGQAEALAQAIAKHLSSISDEAKKFLKLAGLLSTDMRNVERKVPGFRKSRKKEQFSKR